MGSQSGCTRSGSYRGEFVPSSGTAPISINPYSPGEYFRVPVLAGGCYTVSTCGAPFDTHINCFQGAATTGPFSYDDDSGPSCAGTAASVQMVPNFTGYANVDIRQYPCLPGGSSSITVQLSQNNNLAFTSPSTNMCQGEVRTLTATPVPVTGAMPNSGSSGSFSGSGVVGATFTAPAPSGNSQNFVVTYSFGYVNTTQTITVYHTPTVANAGPNQTVCAATTNLAGNVATFGTGTWAVVSGTGIVNTPNSPTSQLSNLTAGQSTTLTWTISNGPCAVSRDTVVISRDVVPTVANAGLNQNVCADTINLTGNAPTVGTGTWTRPSGFGSIQFPNNPTSLVTGLGVGTNVFVWTITNGVCPASRDTVVFVRDALSPTALAGPDKLICDSTTTLTGNIPSVGSGVWSILNGSGTVTNPSSPNSSLTGIGVGTTVLVWTITNGTCPPSRDTILVTRSPIPAAPTVTGPQSVCYGSSVTLTAATLAANPSIVWWDAPAGGNALSGGSTYTSPPLTSSIGVYAAVTDGNTQCTSNRTQYNVSVNPLPIVNIGSDTTICDADTLCLDAGTGVTSYAWNTGATTRQFCTNQAGFYWVEVIDPNGCHGQDTIQISTTPSPVANLGPDIIVCDGNSGTIGLAAVNGLSYSWSTGDTTNNISVSTAGIYTITITDQVGCTGSDAVEVIAHNSPVAAFSTDTSGCPQIVFTDNSTGGTSWAWSFGDGSSSASQNPTYSYQTSGNGSYNVTLIVTNDCGQDTIMQPIAISCVVGLQMPSNLVITLYPNPSDGRFKVRFVGLEGEVDFSVFNALGQQVYLRKFEGCNGTCEESVDLHDVAKGTYFAKIKVGDAVISKQLLIR